MMLEGWNKQCSKEFTLCSLIFLQALHDISFCFVSMVCMSVTNFSLSLFAFLPEQQILLVVQMVWILLIPWQRVLSASSLALSSQSSSASPSFLCSSSSLCEGKNGSYFLLTTILLFLLSLWIVFCYTLGVQGRVVYIGSTGSSR